MCSEKTNLPKPGEPETSAAPRGRKPTEDERLLETFRVDRETFLHTDPWRVFRVMGELVEGFDSLAHLGPAVSVFG
ncbi:MAG TPA: TIGR00730 family Rossman fold protein, partial [Sumerlaeia bacterium]|nr:TIGR00730 family Rossman fold protein [Sumerlaeia bacterium]